MVGLMGVIILFTQMMNSAAVAAIMAPISIQVAHTAGVDPRMLAMGVALALSVAFITSLGHLVNALVLDSGGCKFGDYAKVG